MEKARRHMDEGEATAAASSAASVAWKQFTPQFREGQRLPRSTVGCVSALFY